MKEINYKCVDLTIDNGLDVARLYQKVTGEQSVSAQSLARFLDQLEKTEQERALVPGSQKGFVVYEGDNPVGSLEILHPTLIDEDIIRQRLDYFMTDPQARSIRVLHTMFARLIQTQNPDYYYCYDAGAEATTTYKGLKHPGVQKWLGRNGYAVDFSDDHDEAAKNNETRVIFLYPKRKDLV